MANKLAIFWMQEAAEEAKKSLCQNAKCGAIIVKKDAIIGRGYNSPPKNQKGVCSKTSKHDQCLHAEWRAIMEILRHHADKIKGSKIYFTRVDATGSIIKSGLPYCTVCSRLALDVGIAKFVLWHDDGIREYPTDEYNKLSYQNRPEHFKFGMVK